LVLFLRLWLLKMWRDEIEGAGGLSWDWLSVGGVEEKVER
jgi:hypothetical protein